MAKTATSIKAMTAKPVKKTEAKQAKVPIWEKIRQRMENVPAEELAQLPSDGAEEHDHYLYGSPKRNSS